MLFQEKDPNIPEHMSIRKMVRQFVLIKRGGFVKKIYRAFAAITVLLFVCDIAMPCTDFRLKTEDDTVIVGRSMEFGVELGSKIRVKPRGVEYAFEAQDGSKGLNWRAKYGMVYLDGFGEDLVVDGINEKGLCFEALYFPGFAKYQVVPKGGEARSLPQYCLGLWILSNFETVKEVSAALPDIYLYEKIVKGMDMALPIHFAVHDASGEGIVIEYTDEGRKVYNNKIGVMTNAPSYDWQITNLRNYVNLSPDNVRSAAINGEKFDSLGQGSGSLGLPGDWTPPSRFVRTAFMVSSVRPGKNAAEGINAAQHILNAVDIPRGVVRGIAEGKTEYDITEWVVVKDLASKVLYYRTYDDLGLRSVHLDSLALDQRGRSLKMDMKSVGGIRNVTEELKENFDK